VKERLIDPMTSSEIAEEPSLARLAHQTGLPDDNLRRIAQKGAIPFLERVDLNGSAVERALIEWEPAVIAFTGGGLVRNNILQIPSVGVLNCHSGLLPRYRGMDVVEWAILENRSGAPPVGLTLHLMDRGVDTGPILIRHPEDIHPGDRLESLRGRLEVQMGEMMMKGLRGLRDGSLKPEAQTPDAGHQYFVIHPRLREIATTRLSLM
jgi:methionyl-tRNA formyltransferase